MEFEREHNDRQRHRARRTAIYTALLLLIPTLIALEELPKFAALAPGGLVPGPGLGVGPGPGPGTGNGRGSGPGKGSGAASMMISVSRPADMNIEEPGPRSAPSRAPAARDALYGDTRRVSTPRVADARDPALANQPREVTARDPAFANVPREVAARDGVHVARTPDQRPDLAGAAASMPAPPRFEPPPPIAPPPRVNSPPPPEPVADAPPMLPVITPQAADTVQPDPSARR